MGDGREGAGPLLGRREFAGVLLGLGAVACGYRAHRRDILVFPHPLLRAVAAPVIPGDPKVVEVERCLRDSCAGKNGYGLAAPQIGVPLRVVLVQLDSRSHLLVNPSIVRRVGSYESTEGCLSLPDHPRLAVPRHEVVDVAYWDAAGRPRRHTARGHAAAIVQHELDHLDGRLYIDRGESDAG